MTVEDFKHFLEGSSLPEMYRIVDAVADELHDRGLDHEAVMMNVAANTVHRRYFGTSASPKDWLVAAGLELERATREVSELVCITCGVPIGAPHDSSCPVRATS